MKVRMLFRQIQEVPVDNREKQKELEHRSDLAALRLGIPLPTRFRPFTGNMNSRIRIHEREYESIADFTRLHVVWANDEECKKIDEEWERCYNWERRELLYVDDSSDPIMPWIQMAAEQGHTRKYVVNPDYTMAKDQDSYKGLKEGYAMRMVYRQTQEIPFEKLMQELELERKTDEEEARLGHPLPRRYRMWTGAEHSQIRVHERIYEDFELFGKLFEEWAEDEECQKLEVERHNYYVWEREELLYVDDPIDVDALKKELEASMKKKK